VMVVPPACPTDTLIVAELELKLVSPEYIAFKVWVPAVVKRCVQAGTTPAEIVLTHVVVADPAMASLKVTVPVGMVVPELAGVTVAFRVVLWSTAGLVGVTVTAWTEVPSIAIVTEKDGVLVLVLKLLSPL